MGKYDPTADAALWAAYHCVATIRLEVEKIVKQIGLDFIVNVVVNEKKQVVKAFAGDFVMAHRSGVEDAKKIYTTKIPTRADIVVCESHPSCYGVDMWESDKAVMGSYLAIKPGGTILQLAPLSEGVSSEHPELNLGIDLTRRSKN